MTMVDKLLFIVYPPKLSQRIRKHYYETLGTSVNNFPSLSVSSNPLYKIGILIKENMMINTFSLEEWIYYLGLTPDFHVL